MCRGHSPPEGINRIHRYFCYVCGTLLPSKITPNDSFQCRKCLTYTYLSWFIGMKTRFDSENVIDCEITNFQTLPIFDKILSDAQKTHKAEEALRKVGERLPINDNIDGPSVKRDCPYCGNSTMTYVTMQLRAADEGQTVIYTCTELSEVEFEAHRYAPGGRIRASLEDAS
nr:DNA directed RNA polymerase I subunit RPA12 [Hymenolepis microstoma]